MLKAYTIGGITFAYIKHDHTIEMPEHNERLDAIVKAVAMAFEKLGVGFLPTITSGKEYLKRRLINSKHYLDFAFDFSLHGLSEGQIAYLPSAIGLALAELNGLGYDVVLKSDHLHVEYDPKKPAQFTAIEHSEDTKVDNKGLQEAKNPPAMPEIEEDKPGGGPGGEIFRTNDERMLVQFACAALTGLLANPKTAPKNILRDYTQICEAARDIAGMMVPAIETAMVRLKNL